MISRASSIFSSVRGLFSGFGSDSRGQSYLLGTMLIIGITVVVTVSSFAVGLGFINMSQTQSETQKAAQAFQTLASESSLVAYGENPGSKVDLGLQNPSQARVTDTGVFRVETLNRSDGSVEETLLEERLRAVEYRIDSSGDARQRTVVYQSGGVWVQRNGDPNATVVRTSPRMSFSKGTLTLPLMSVSSPSENIGTGDVQLSKNESTAVYPNTSAGRVNPVENRKIRLSYEGEYYTAWGDVFEQRFDGDVSVTDSREMASVVLVTPDLVQSVQSGLQAGGSASEGVFIRGSGGSPSFVDSYNSSEGAYSTSSSSDGSIRAAGDITLRGGAAVRGDAVVPPGYNVDVRGGSEVTGDVRYEEVRSVSVTNAVYERCGELQESNDNAETSAINGSWLDSSESSWSLSEGSYFISGDLVVESGEELRFDNSAGDIELCVGGDVDVSGGSVAVSEGGSGAGRVDVFQRGDAFSVTGGGEVVVPGDDSSVLWFYGDDGVDVTVRDSRVVGVISMPAGEDGDGSALVQSGGEVFGAVISGPIEMRSGGRVHYDQSLVTADALESLESVTVVSYLHVDVVDVQINGRE